MELFTKLRSKGTNLITFKYKNLNLSTLNIILTFNAYDHACLKTKLLLPYKNVHLLRLLINS